jgi:hypothetical protein
MKEPKFGSNRTQSFIDYETTVGKLRLGLEDLRLFAEVGNQKIYITDSSGNLTATVGEASVGAGVPIDGTLIKDGTLTKVTPLLKTGFDTVSIVEYGDGMNNVSVLTLTDFIIGTIPAAAAALGVGAAVAYFPASPGVHIEDAYAQSLSLKLPGTVVNADVGLGSVVATGAINLLSGTGTFEDRLTGQTIPTAIGGGAVTKAVVRASAAGIALNIAASVKDIMLNAAGTWNVNNAGSLTASGTIVIKWTKIE